MKSLPIIIRTLITTGMSEAGWPVNSGRFFESKDGKQSITIYHFDNGEKLVRLLVHELGHALRLPHSENSQAVMYRLNQYDTAELTADDITALKTRCEK